MNLLRKVLDINRRAGLDCLRYGLFDQVRPIMALKHLCPLARSRTSNPHFHGRIDPSC